MDEDRTNNLYEELGLVAPKHGQKWGNWTLDTEHLTLDYEDVTYSIRLSSMTSSAEVLDWIAQLNEKTWVSREDIGNLVQAVDDIFDLHSFCGMGRDHRINAEGFLKSRFSTSS
jgi:hypothetical protein